MMRWWLCGGVLGALLAGLAFAPAAWLAQGVAHATGGRFTLSDAQGTVWNGSAVATLTGGVGSRDASALPGRLHWQLSLKGLGLDVHVMHACCIHKAQTLRVVPGWQQIKLQYQPADPVSGLVGHWPAAWLVGLGTPWNTLMPTGNLQVNSPGWTLESTEGRWLFNGRAEFQLLNMASRISTLDQLGSYKLQLAGDNARGEATNLNLNTLSGALQLQGSGEWAGSRLRFRGQAQAAPGAEAALSNLLNIIGRRQGAVAVISIG